jgi:hypothetical protein
MIAAKLQEVGTNVVTYTWIEEHIEIGQVIFHYGYLWEVVEIEVTLH